MKLGTFKGFCLCMTQPKTICVLQQSLNDSSTPFSCCAWDSEPEKEYFKAHSSDSLGHTLTGSGYKPELLELTTLVDRGFPPRQWQ